jgi:hypothetical protein
MLTDTPPFTSQLILRGQHTTGRVLVLRTFSTPPSLATSHPPIRSNAGEPMHPRYHTDPTQRRPARRPKPLKSMPPEILTDAEVKRLLAAVSATTNSGVRN